MFITSSCNGEQDEKKKTGRVYSEFQQAVGCEMRKAGSKWDSSFRLINNNIDLT